MRSADGSSASWKETALVFLYPVARALIQFRSQASLLCLDGGMTIVMQARTHSRSWATTELSCCQRNCTCFSSAWEALTCMSRMALGDRPTHPHTPHMHTHHTYTHAIHRHPHIACTPHAHQTHTCGFSAMIMTLHHRTQMGNNDVSKLLLASRNLFVDKCKFK